MDKKKTIDTHAHLDRNYDLRYFDKVADDGIIQEIWMQSLDFHIESPDYTYARTQHVVEAAKRFPGLIIPYGYIDWRQGADQVRRLKDMGCFGLKAFRPTLPYNDYSYFPIYAEAEKLGMPVLFHVGIISRRQRWELEDPNNCIGPDKMRPCFIDTIAAEFPRLKLIQGHLGVPWCNEMFESLWYYDNIMASVCGLVDWKWLIENLDRRSEHGVPYHQKLMYGSDATYGRTDIDYIYDEINFYRGFFDRVGQTYCWGTAKEDFMYNNAVRLMKEDFFDNI